MRLLFLLSLLTVTGLNLASARAVPASHVVHEKKQSLHTRWLKRGRVASHVKLPVRIGLKQNQVALAQAEDWLIEVSHPTSNRYGQHWSQAEINEAFAPHEDSVATVKQWIASVLGDKPVTHSDNKAWLAFDATVSEIERLVHAQYHEAHDEASGRVMISCGKYPRLRDV